MLRDDPLRPPRSAMHECVARRQLSGFTLLELLVVIAVIATLAAVVAPSVFRHIGDARVASARSQIEILGLALTQYGIDNGTLPTTEQGLIVLRQPPTATGLDGAPLSTWKGPYLDREIPLDPWGRPYQYLSPGRVNLRTYDLYSLGKDGRPGGDGEDADITSWGGSVDTGGA